MDIARVKQYINLKGKADEITIYALNDAHAARFPTFDMTTGAKVDDEELSIDLLELEKRKTEIDSQILALTDEKKNLQTVIDDIKAIK